MLKSVCLIIRDGWGISENVKGNAVMAAKTPNIDIYKSENSLSIIECSGVDVGLPAGYQGSSEVGHLNMGAGRIVEQELKRIDDSLRKGLLFDNDIWRAFVDKWRKNSSKVHLMGLLQDEGVHAHQEHLFKIMRRLRSEYPEGKIVIHPFLDGRDTPPRSTLDYITKLQDVMNDVGGCKIGTSMGRYYAMDRSKQWDITNRAFKAIESGDCKVVSDLTQEIIRAYKEDKTPDDVSMTDEYIEPVALEGYEGVADNDCVMHLNYRQDRAIQLTQVFLEKKPKVNYLGFTKYYEGFETFLLPSMSSGGGMNNLLGEVVSRAGLQQLRIAETQKFRHVTSFFNGKSTLPYQGEDQVEVPTRFDPATFASHPEMEAYNVTDELLRRVEKKHYDLIVVNYANGDMVGHTGDIKAATRAIEVVDECVGKLSDKLLEKGYEILIAADHGNAEEMLTSDGKGVKTSHTLNPIECIYVSRSPVKRVMVSNGKLSDIAPTILELMDLEIPSDMTANSLLQKGTF